MRTRQGWTTRLAAMACIAAVLLCGRVCAVDVPAGDAREAQTLVLGVHPYLAPGQLRLRFAPLAAHLSALVQRPVEVRVGADYAGHVAAIGNDTIDIAYLGPASYVRLTQAFGDKPLLARLERKGRAVLTGHVIVRQDSPVGSITELRGHSFAFGDPNSTMSTRVPMAALRNAGVDLGQLAHYYHFPGHTNVALAVLSGQMDAGAVKSEVFDRHRDRGLRSLLRLPEISEHLFVARAGLPDAIVRRIRDAMLTLHQTQRGRQVLSAIHRDATALVPVRDTDYDSLRAILDPTGEPDAKRRQQP